MNTQTSQKLRVFLCHASDDKPFVRALALLLRAFGVEPWLDEEQLMGGEDWELRIRKAVRTSHAVVVCLSHASINKAGFVQKEIRIALDVADEQPEDAIFLIPLKIEPCDIPERLKKLHWINFYEKNGHEYLLKTLTTRATSLGVAIPTDEHMDQMSDLLQPESLASYGFEPKAIMAAELLALNLEEKFEISETRLETYMDAYPEDHKTLYFYLQDLLEEYKQYDRVIRIVSKYLQVVQDKSVVLASHILNQRGTARLRRWYKISRSEGDLLSAEKDFLASIEFNPELSTAYFHLAIVYAVRSDLIKVDIYLAHAIKTCTDDSWTVRINDLRNMARETPEKFLLGMKNFYR